MNLHYFPFSGINVGDVAVEFSYVAVDKDADPTKAILDLRRVFIKSGNRAEFEAKGQRFASESAALTSYGPLPKLTKEEVDERKT